MLPPSASPPRAIALACAGCAWLLAAGAALAQASVGLTVDSEYRFRGVSLGGPHPSLRADFNYDAAHGWYAGASLARAQFADAERYLQITAYGGRVVPVAPELDLDAGASLWRFSGGDRDFAEAYAGLMARRWSARLHYSPNYFHEGVATLYLDADAHRLLSDDWRVFAHAGALVRVGSAAAPEPSSAYDGRAALRRTRWDVRVGMGYSATDRLDLQLAWTRASRGGPVPVTHEASRAAWVASAAWSF